jgi:hypothetical protein
MTAPESLRGIIADAADPADRDDVATRRILVTELGIVLAMCPSPAEWGWSIAAQSTANQEDRAPDLCALGRPLTPACRGCLLSR